MGKRELVALHGLSSWCLVSWVCLQFVILEFPDHTHCFNCRNLHLYFSSMQMNIESLSEYRKSVRGSDKERENANYLYMYHKYISWQKE